jgi:hypothetical protein
VYVGVWLCVGVWLSVYVGVALRGCAGVGVLCINIDGDLRAVTEWVDSIHLS